MNQQLVDRFLKVSIADVEGNEYTNSRVGIAQGSIVSPILANIYRNSIDVEMVSLMRILALNTLDMRTTVPSIGLTSRYKPHIAIARNRSAFEPSYHGKHGEMPNCIFSAAPTAWEWKVPRYN